MNKKYELTDETKEIGGITLHRIRALRDIPRYGVKYGDLGGWIESESNLSQYGNAWVSGEARVSGNASVCGDASVSGNACVCDNAMVSGNASVCGNAAKMRDALSDACYAMFNFLKTQNGGYEEMANALDKAKATLAEPIRNCDVGTAEEQLKRFNKFCFPIKCKECKLYTDEDLHDCIFRWHQMPYEEGGAEWMV